MKKTLLTLMMILGSYQAYAQNVKRPENYNYQRGIEAVQEQKLDEALKYFNADIEENPKGGYPYMWVSYLRLVSEDYGKALTAANMAIKYIPKKDAEYLSFAYKYRAKTYLCLEDTVQGLADYSAAIKTDPKNVDLYNDRGQIYYEQEKYELADADYRKIIELDAGDVMGYMGVGRNANARKRWNDAIKEFDYVVKLASDYASGYSFRAESYIGLEKWSEATDDIVQALSLDWDKKAIYMATTLKEPAFTMLVAKLKVQSAKASNEWKWPYYLALVYESNKQYAKAIDYYTDANNKNMTATGHYRISHCYYKFGDYDKALSSINQALNIDSTEVEYVVQKANIFYEKGDAKSAIAEWDKVLAAHPDYAYGYYRRGWFKTLAGDNDGAIEDLSMSIVLEPKFTHAIETRGDIYLRQGKKDLAEIDFKKVIEIEDTPEKYEVIHYAYQGLGQYDKAIAIMDSIMAKDTTDYSNYYDAACLYSRMHDKENALKYLEKALEHGYVRFAHIERDFDMDFIRDTKEFKALIRKYKKQTESNNGPVAIGVFDVDTPDKITEVPFTKENGVCKVKCHINGLPLHFVFDTGASDVTLSMVEANFMMKNGYLSDKDVVGNQHYIDANGDVSVGTTINLKEVNFGGQSLTNVRASVVRNQKAPLLLGQSVLGRLGKIEIDNTKLVIRITHNK